MQPTLELRNLRKTFDGAKAVDGVSLSVPPRSAPRPLRAAPARAPPTLRTTFDGAKAVDGVSLSVPPGTVFGLLGPTGAGKTTPIRMLMDIIGPDEGEVAFFGHPRTRRDLDRIGYLPEERGLYRKMTVKEQLVYLGELDGLPKKTLGARADEGLGARGGGE